MKKKKTHKKPFEYAFGLAGRSVTAAALLSTTMALGQSPAPADPGSSLNAANSGGSLPNAPVPQNLPSAPASRRVLLSLSPAEEGVKPAAGPPPPKPRRKYGETIALDVIGRSKHFGVPPSVAKYVDNNNLGGIVKYGGTIQYFFGGYPGSNEGEPIVGGGAEYDRRFKLNSSTLVYGGAMVEFIYGYPRKPDPKVPFSNPISPFGGTLVFGAEKKLPESWGREAAKYFGQGFADHFSHCYAGPRLMYVPSNSVSVLNLGGQLECNFFMPKPKKDAHLSDGEKGQRSDSPRKARKFLNFGRH